MKTKLNLFFLIITLWSCSDDDDDCPDSLEVNINDPASLERAEECGLSPAVPIGESVWLYTLSE
ncbi:MAG: hypothetical protein AAGC45_07985 [Bacteroidota bacterium]